jgi:glutamyl-Q tRNA(Asp) synthetase
MPENQVHQRPVEASAATPPPYRGRFAPSPTGPLHLGSLTAALGSWLMARSQGGQWLLRIEDIDPPREVAGAARAQLRDLAAFGLQSDEPVAWQSRRSDLYADALQLLLDRDLAFACRCSRSDLAGSAGVHHQCVAHPSGRLAAIRLRVPPRTLAFEDRFRGRVSQDLGRDVGDFVLRRADGYWAYQLAVVVDDAAQAITEVVRGADLIDSTPRQILLHQLLGKPVPAYAHLPVVRLPDGSKLGKSLRSTPLDPADPLPALRLAYGWLGQEVGALAGVGGVEATLARALAEFDPGRVGAGDRVLSAD